jgi:hypothetical protein
VPLSSLTTKAAPERLGKETKETGAACSEEDRGLPEGIGMKPSPSSYEECYAPKGAQKYTPKRKRQKGRTHEGPFTKDPTLHPGSE